MSASSPTSLRVRRVPSTLIEALSLQHNLLLEPMLQQQPPHPGMLQEFEDLFRRAGQPVELDPWATLWPDAANVLQSLQARVGCALMGDPAVLEIGTEDWPEAVLPKANFHAAFQGCFPWRRLRWVDGQASRIDPNSVTSP